ncbi:signal recognition particle 9 kDa protein isoform X2 [Neovison vison]|uniref:signal recognition particle 9 kDa protein isoform X2 n=1 Tax=Neovison vison TaxID=452646 RepID=UPI001CF04D16|nr:signal recognition particle 9 kDa protein isoform X2 [Neogale vison]
MPQYQTWEEFSRAAEKLYLADPMKARVVLKYRHSDGSLCIKVTDDLVGTLDSSSNNKQLLEMKNVIAGMKTQKCEEKKIQK